MIETRKYSTLKGPICNRDYSDAPSISWYFIANEFDCFLHTCASMALSRLRVVSNFGDRLWGGRNPKTLNGKQSNV